MHYSWMEGWIDRWIIEYWGLQLKTSYYGLHLQGSVYLCLVKSH